MPESISVFPSVSLFVSAFLCGHSSSQMLFAPALHAVVSPPSGGSILAVLDAEPITHDRKHKRIWRGGEVVLMHTPTHMHTHKHRIYLHPLGYFLEL